MGVCVHEDTTFAIVNFNGGRFLRGCLSSIAAQGGQARIVVVDNGSEDDSVQILKKEFPDVRLIRNADNAGFAAAANQAVEAAETRFVALVNSDVVLADGWLSSIKGAFDSTPEVACVGSRMLSKDGQKTDFDGGTVNFYGFGQQRGFGSPVNSQKPEDRKPVEETIFACAGAMVVERDAFTRVGGFDASFFAYFEDVDLGYRLWLSGYRVLLSREAVAYHEHHGTSKRFLSDASMAFLAERNALCFVLKNSEEENLARTLPASLFMSAARVLERLKDEGSSETSLFEKATASLPDALQMLNELGPQTTVPVSSLSGPLAFVHVLHNMDEILKSRRKCQSLRQVSDSDILRRFPGFLFPSFFSKDYYAIEEKLIEHLGLHVVLGEEHSGPLIVEQMTHLNERFIEEIDRLQYSRAADRGHISGLEITLRDRSHEVERLHKALSRKQDEIGRALAAVGQKQSEIEHRDRILAEKESVIEDAFRSLRERDDRLERADASLAEKDKLVTQFEGLAEERKRDILALSSEREQLKGRLERIESTRAYRIYVALRRLLKLRQQSTSEPSE